MSIVLSVYSKNALKEFVLPSVNNTEVSLLLDHHVFQTPEDYRLALEVLDGNWYFCKTVWDRIYTGENRYEGRKLKDQDSYTVLTGRNELLAIVIQVKESSFSVYSKFSLDGISEITIGNSSDETMVCSRKYNHAQLISRHHATLRKEGAGWTLEDSSSNGTFVNDIRVQGRKILEFGDQINIWGLRMVYLSDVLSVDTSVLVTWDTSVLKQWISGQGHLTGKAPERKEKIYYHRAPRNMEKLETEAVEIEAPPALQEESETPLWMLVGPSMTMMLPMLIGSVMSVASMKMSGGAGSGFLYTGIITAVSSGIFGVFWAINNVRYAKTKARREETRRFDAYSAYLMRCTEEIKEKYARNTCILQKMYPSAEEVIASEEKIPVGLWGRNRSHEDFLFYRLGIGDMLFQVPIEIPKERFTLINDSLVDKPRFIRNSYQTLHQIPVGVDLEKNTLIGVVGGVEKAGAYLVVYDLTAQIITQNCYTDVKLVFLAGSEKRRGRDAWSFALWLPHVWSQNKKSRYVALDASEVSDVCYDLTQILRQRMESAAVSGTKEESFAPYYVVIVEDEALLEGELLKKYIFEKNCRLGLTTILMTETCEKLPNACECIIQNDDSYQGCYDTRTGKNKGISIKFDRMDALTLKKLARRLANLEVSEIETGGEIPQAITFFDMYGIQALKELNVEERWKKNRTYDSLRALIGIKTGGQPCYLDLHEKYHGPHGLVAGTTGSGKSETLQTYILSLVLNFSPDDVGLFIIDYKGGGMGNLFSGLPHVLGQISNLSGNQIRRAMVSIKSENLRRQRVFNENGVNNINAYTRLYKSGEAKQPVPHLFIIIDEFAELKREEPDFMRELISVAQVGRSLGVHLILATQKPSGTVDDNIWSNSKFRLCLRVQDRQDSMDMLHKADAAYITQAGRGYLQVGNDEIYELFQSGWSGAPYDEETGNEKQVIATMLTNTGRTGIVGNYLKSRRKAEAKLRWMEQLLGLTEEAYAQSKQGIHAKKAEITEALYKKMRQAGIDYPESDYNTKLLKNLLEHYQEAVGSLKTRESKSGLCRYVLELSEHRGSKLPEQKEKTQLNAVIEYLAQVTEKAGYQKQKPLWLPVLPQKLPLRKLEGYEENAFISGQWPEYGERWELKAIIGLYDFPENQYQAPLILNFTEDGNHAVCGIGMSGKSTFLQTMVYSLIQHYSPEYLNLYLLDFSSRMMEPFEEDVHVGGVLYENDLATVGKFFHMLQKMIQERKTLFRGGNYYQYVAKHGMVCPAVVVVIDNMANFREKTGEQYDDILLQISRECTANGIYLFLSGAGYSMNEIPGRLGENIRRTISLEMPDKFGYADVLNMMQIAALPDSGIAGRGLVQVDGIALEFQACLAVDAMDDYGRIEKIRSECERMSSCWSGKLAKAIPHIPEKPVWSEFCRLEEVKKQFQGRKKLPFGYNLATADIAGMDLAHTYCYLISGKARTGKTNLLRIMMRAAKAKQGRLILVEFGTEELRTEAEALEARYVDSEAEYLSFIQTMIPVFQERSRLQKSMRAQAMEDEEIFARMSEEEPCFIFIADLAEYVKAMHGEFGRENNLCGAMTNFLEKGSLLNIYFIAAFNWDKRGEAIGLSVYESFIRYKTGVHLGGNADSQSILEFQDISYKELSGADKAGCGILAYADPISSIRVVTPFARG